MASDSATSSSTSTLICSTAFRSAAISSSISASLGVPDNVVVPGYCRLCGAAANERLPVQDREAATRLHLTLATADTLSLAPIPWCAMLCRWIGPTSLAASSREVFHVLVY